jgi:cell division septation protein DedD
MTFYKSVEQKDVRPQLTPASEDANSTGRSSGSTVNLGGTNPAKDQTPATSSAPDPMAMPATNGYYVQVAAVSKDEDAQSLVDALKNKQYPAFVASNSTDKLFRVQVGPFADIKDAEGMRARLINDGYNPILKK